MKIRVLFIIWALEKGGAERFLTGLLKNIDLNEFDPVLCCLNWKGNWGEEVESHGIPVIALHKTKKIDFTAFFRLITIIKQGEFQIVNTHLWLADCMGRLAAIICGVPIIISTAQNVDVWKKWHHRLIDRFLGIFTHQMIAVSKAVKNYYNQTVKIPEKKIQVVCNAIDATMYNDTMDTEYLYQEFNIPKNHFILACVGRLSFQKGHRYLFESLAQLKSKLPNVCVLLVGDGELREELQDLAKEKNIEEMVRFTGQRNDIAQILNFSQGMILPSIFEGLPLCVLEAMAAKCPVIATDVGGTAELAVDQQTAFIIPPKDIEALNAAIINLHALPDQGKSMGEAGRKIVEEKFSIQKITRQTEFLFKDLIRKKL